ncbi:MAG: fumarylacetoacetate hydrolase family protein [Candidatus Brocadiales bacterium]|nr:fumarylacetoacetate hydrolase family protein [Candidatus Brocadiales bacterium]MBL7005500.1 fumarylacetoacetate hydrolase family protein [Spirochaetia bacterium]
MAFHRSEFPVPSNVGIIDYNGRGVFAHYGLVERDYPGLVPSVDTTIAFAGDEKLILLPWQKELHLHAELVVVIGRDVQVREVGKSKDVLIGYSLGLGIWDNALIKDLENMRVRDVHLNRDYGYLIDNSRQQGTEIISPGKISPLQNLSLNLFINEKKVAVFNQKELLFDGERVLRECNKLIAFRRGDIICLGPSNAPVVIDERDLFEANSTIRIEAPPFKPIEIVIDDRREPDGVHTWPGCDVDFISRYSHLK